MAFQAVAWDEEAWRELYPQFSGITSAQLDMLWQMACTIVDNTETSPFPYDPDNNVYVRKIILYALMCHLATLATWDANGQQGALASASEGSVSASFQMPQYPATSVSAQWYNQTLCGRTAFNLLRAYALGGRYYAVKHFHPFG